MASPKAKVGFKFLKDEPADKGNGGIFEFYHSNIAPALARMLRDPSSPHTIGLFGAWGTGKSTIVKMLKDDQALKAEAPIFIFDAWKYQHGDSLRRIFLRALADFINADDSVTGKIDLEDLDSKLYKAKTTSVTSQEPAAKPKPSIWIRLKSNWVIVVTVISLVAWVGLQFLVKTQPFLAPLRDVVKSIVGLSFVIFVGQLLLSEVIKNGVAKLMKEVTVAANLRTMAEFEDRLNSPEQFERLFKEIIKKLDKKLVIVFDNMDRVQGDVAISMLSTIKTFLDPVHEPGLVFIIPCDADAVKEQITKFYESDSNRGKFDASEYLRKVFNLIIWAPEFISADLEEYTKKKLSETGDIKSLINKDDVALVINAAFSKNPREIIQFINNLIAQVLVASETDVWPELEKNIPYLAKVLVLKQKFPAAYHLLTERWNEPENITDAEPSANSETSELAAFMNLTDRISTDDAEPFIYFKLPVRSSNIKDSDALRSALVTGDREKASELIAKENSDDQVAEFVCDLLDKYGSQPKALLNIFVTHAAIFSDRNSSISLVRYYHTALRAVDQQLWQTHQVLPVTYVMNLVDSDKATKKLRTAILDRYIAVLEAKDNAESYSADIFENLIGIKARLTNEQRDSIRQVLAANYANSDTVLDLFDKLEDQTFFVSKQALSDFITGMTEKNAVGRSATMYGYKDFLAENGLTQMAFSKLAQTLASLNSSNPSDSAAKTSISKCISRLISAYQGDVRAEILGAAADELAEALAAGYPQIPQVDARADLVTCMYWIRNYGAQAHRESIRNLIADYFTNATTAGLSPAIVYWNENTRHQLIKENLPQLLPRLGDDSILNLVYEYADDPTRLAIIEHLGTLRANADVNFVAGLKTYPGKQETLSVLVTRAGNLTYNLRGPYYDFLSSKLSSGDKRETKDAVIAQSKGLLHTDDAQSQRVAYELITRLKILTETYKRDIGKDLLDWLKQPGRVINSSQLYSFKVLSFIFGSLQDPPQNEIVYILFNLLSDAHDVPTITMALDTLIDVRPGYTKYSKDYDDAVARMTALPDEDPRKQLIRDGLAKLAPTKITAKERSFWNSLKIA